MCNGLFEGVYVQERWNRKARANPPTNPTLMSKSRSHWPHKLSDHVMETERGLGGGFDKSPALAVQTTVTRTMSSAEDSPRRGHQSSEEEEEEFSEQGGLSGDEETGARPD